MRRRLYHKISIIDHTLNKYDMVFLKYLDLLPLYLVYFVLENGNYVMENNIFLVVIITELFSLMLFWVLTLDIYICVCVSLCHNSSMNIVIICVLLLVVICELLFVGDMLLVGTRQGHLLVYSVRSPQGCSDTKFDVLLERSNKAFAKKPITQLAVVPEYHILISMSGELIPLQEYL